MGSNPTRSASCACHWASSHAKTSWKSGVLSKSDGRFVLYRATKCATSSGYRRWRDALPFIGSVPIRRLTPRRERCRCTSARMRPASTPSSSAPTRPSALRRFTLVSNSLRNRSLPRNPSCSHLIVRIPVPEAGDRMGHAASKAQIMLRNNFLSGCFETQVCIRRTRPQPAPWPGHEERQGNRMPGSAGPRP